MDNLYPTYGILATTVNPNPKCEGCLHYAANQGPTGVCQLGLRPFNCGDGDAPRIGYAPVVATGPDTAPDAVTSVQAPVVSGEPSREVAQKTVFLGEEYVGLAKSMYEEMARESSANCPLHQQRSVGSGQSNLACATMLKCTCAPVDEQSLVKAFSASLSNALRHELDEQAIIAFVRKATAAVKKREVSLFAPGTRPSWDKPHYDYPKHQGAAPGEVGHLMSAGRKMPTVESGTRVNPTGGTGRRTPPPVPADARSLSSEEPRKVKKGHKRHHHTSEGPFDLGKANGAQPQAPKPIDVLYRECTAHAATGAKPYSGANQHPPALKAAALAHAQEQGLKGHQAHMERAEKHSAKGYQMRNSDSAQAHAHMALASAHQILASRSREP